MYGESVANLEILSNTSNLSELKNIPTIMRSLLVDKKKYRNFYLEKEKYLDNLTTNRLAESMPSRDDHLSKKIIINIDTYSSKKDLKFQNIDYHRIKYEQTAEAPKLSMKLQCVVENPGIYPLDTIKKLNNSKKLKLLEQLPKPDDIIFENLDTYIRPSEDKNLKKIMKSNNYKYSSSTSGIGATLTHFFYKLTNFKSPHFYNLSESYQYEPLKFMMYQRKPASIKLHRFENNFYTINSNHLFESKNEFILMKMGKYMEKIFTNEPEEFNRKYMKKSGDKQEIVLKEDDFFNYVGYDKILLRSQIDCAGKNQFGQNSFYEIKTRAVAPIRYDVDNYLDYLDYEINSLIGKHSSYEREYYDLIRGAFLKYLFQLKIGGMDGAFISYHNTSKIFGFEYVTLVDMERRIFGNSNFSDIIFKASLKLLQESLDHILKDFSNEENLIVGFFANEWKGTLDVFVELINENSYKDFHSINPKEVIDYYYITGYRPKVHKYSIVVTPILNNVITTFSPVLYENNDSYDVKYQITYQGIPSFDEYMKFVHENSSKDTMNLENQYTGTWSLTYEK